MIGASILMLVLGWDGNIGRGEGILLFAILICYIVWAVYQSRRETSAVRSSSSRNTRFPHAFPGDSWGGRSDWCSWA